MVVFGIDRGRLVPNLAPVGVKFVRQQHGQRRINALSHLRMVHDHRDVLIGADAHKRVRHKRTAEGWLRRCELGDSEKMKSDQQPAACSDSHLKKITALNPSTRIFTRRFLSDHLLTNHRAPPFATISAAR